MSNSESKVISAKVSAKLLDEVDRYAEVVGCSRDWVISQALATWLYIEHDKHAQTLEALADVDSGRTVPDEKMRSWIESWNPEHPLPLPKPR